RGGGVGGGKAEAPAAAPLWGGPRPALPRCAYWTMSLRLLSGCALTTLRAGLALIMVGSLVNGLMPGRALVAGLWTRLSFNRPGTLNVPGPFLPSCALMRSISASKTSPTCLRVRLVLVAIS